MLVCHLVKEVDRILGTDISKSALHTGSGICPVQLARISRKVPYRFLMVDGTKVRLQEVDQKGHGKKVEMAGL